MNTDCIIGIACCVATLVASSPGAAEHPWIEVGDAVLTGADPAGSWVIELDIDHLEALLASARPEGSVKLEAQPILELPLPDGSFGRFRVEASPIMAPGLAARYPEISSYRGTGLDDPTAVARFDLTLKGFHGMILSAGETVFINPLPSLGRNRYLSFGRTAVAHPPELRPECLTDGGRSPADVVGARKATGPVLRTYRTAIAATGEYTRYHGGTKAEALSAIVVVVNRMNGIFRRELSVELELVADNDLVIYTDPETDPYTHDDTAVLILENQTTLDTVVGTANYDHGHLFNTHPGGRAGDFGTSCNPFSKGQGVSGLRVPAGEVFMVDLVAHEMGHQFGSAHTYNSLERTCAIARNEWAAYEPGSGSTIMSYAGVCGIENIEPHSDDYFHGYSLDEMSAHLAGLGGTCGTSVETGNDPPEVDAGSEHTIPAETPFVLTGSATDASALSFTWEQFDLGPPSPPMDDDGQRPLFRSHPPSLESWRVMPQMDDLLHDTVGLGEILPTTTRTLTFRLTARDGLGGVGADTTRIQVDGTAGPFRVREPLAGDRWAAGEPTTVKWAVAGTSSGPVDCMTVDILLSEDDGVTFPVVLAEATLNDGIEEIEVPMTTTTQARIMVACSDNLFFAVSPRLTVIWWQARPGGNRRSP